MTVTPAPTLTRQKLVVFLRGFTSKLTSDEVTASKDGDFGDDFNPIDEAFLNSKGFLGTTRAIFYSYDSSTSDGIPNPYKCQQTANKHIADYIALLSTQINNALIGHPYTQLPLVPLNDLVKVFATESQTPAPDDSGTDPQGAQASIALALLGGDHRSNEQLAELAPGQGISVLTVGTAQDLLFNPSACPDLHGLFEANITLRLQM